MSLIVYMLYVNHHVLITNLLPSSFQKLGSFTAGSLLIEKMMQSSHMNIPGQFAIEGVPALQWGLSCQRHFPVQLHPTQFSTRGPCNYLVAGPSLLPNVSAGKSGATFTFLGMYLNLALAPVISNLVI